MDPEGSRKGVPKVPMEATRKPKECAMEGPKMLMELQGASRNLQNVVTKEGPISRPYCHKTREVMEAPRAPMERPKEPMEGPKERMPGWPTGRPRRFHR